MADENLGNGWYRQSITQTLVGPGHGWQLAWNALVAAIRKRRVPLEEYDVTVSMMYRKETPDKEVRMSICGIQSVEVAVTDLVSSTNG